MEELLSNMEERVNRTGHKVVSGSFDELHELYLSRLRQNFHLVMCFSPADETFRKRALNYPGILSGCVIDRFFEWPIEALTAVAGHYLRDFDPVSPEVISTVAHIHEITAASGAIYEKQLHRTVPRGPQTFFGFLSEIKSVSFSDGVFYAGY